MVQIERSGSRLAVLPGTSLSQPALPDCRQTRNTEHGTRNPEHETRNPKPSCLGENESVYALLER